MATTGRSMLYSLLSFAIILSLLEMYREKLASSELLTILGGFVSSLLFLLMLTFIGNYQESSGTRTGCGAGEFIALAEIVALVAAATVHRVCITTCGMINLECRVVGLFATSTYGFTLVIASYFQLVFCMKFTRSRVWCPHKLNPKGSVIDHNCAETHGLYNHHPSEACRIDGINIAVVAEASRLLPGEVSRSSSGQTSRSSPGQTSRSSPGQTSRLIPSQVSRSQINSWLGLQIKYWSGLQITSRWAPDSRPSASYAPILIWSQASIICHQETLEGRIHRTPFLADVDGHSSPFLLLDAISFFPPGFLRRQDRTPTPPPPLHVTTVAAFSLIGSLSKRWSTAGMRAAGIGQLLETLLTTQNTDPLKPYTCRTRSEGKIQSSIKRSKYNQLTLLARI
ncbi:hypothetical protein ZIOFF_039188 [Zingiber officinale]|uniref:Dolichyl-diphosphooligosaccharide--protein glycosyltransferase subunit KCP2 n=1 Tax=Zingiber officinale TaxID=94328 RepID=A0A8J5KTA8_ZINOF|nr:hypothetical protein ZIOFF_039188 [Zingiber officinale]